MASCPRTRCRYLAFILVGLLVSGGCSGVKLLRDPVRHESRKVLAEASDEYLQAQLDWVIVRNGPGSWAKNAYWDEYLVRVENLSRAEITILQVSIVDLLGTPVAPRRSRKQLVKASKKNTSRYKDEGFRVEAGMGTTTMLAAGAVATVVGVGAAEVAATGAALSSGSAAGGGTALAGGILLIGPALVIGGIVQLGKNRAVDAEIKNRYTSIPLAVSSREESFLDLFFPIAPSPRFVVIDYSVDGEQNRTLKIDSSAALKDLHVDVRTAERQRRSSPRRIGPRNRR